MSQAYKRSPAAKKRRAQRKNAVVEQALADARAAELWQPPEDPGNLCRRCFQRPHVPLHELCRACRYYTRSEAKS